MTRKLGIRRREYHVRPDILLEFVRELVANTWNGDVIQLSLMAAQHRTGATKREMQDLVLAIMQERSRSGMPEGFMPEFDPEAYFEEE